MRSVKLCKPSNQRGLEEMCFNARVYDLHTAISACEERMEMMGVSAETARYMALIDFIADLQIKFEKLQKKGSA